MLSQSRGFQSESKNPPTTISTAIKAIVAIEDADSGRMRSNARTVPDGALAFSIENESRMTPSIRLQRLAMTPVASYRQGSAGRGAVVPWCGFAIQYRRQTIVDKTSSQVR